MCFSPEVDIAAGVVVGAIGIGALRHVHYRRELPLGSLPVLFGAHQLTETFVWWGLRGEAAESTYEVALWAYVAFAYIVLPLLAPLAVWAVEPDARRRRLIGRFAAVGAVVSGVYLMAMLDGPVGAEIVSDKISYDTRVAYGGVVAAVYMFATVGALLSSSHRRIATFGAANLVALPVLTFISTVALASLWCAWAAVCSLVIASHFHMRDSDASRPRPSIATLPGQWLERFHLGAR